MSAPHCAHVVVVGRDAALWLSANVIRAALGGSGVTVTAVELPSRLGPPDVYATLPPLEALHNQLRVDESALLRTVQGAFTLGQNFAEAGKAEGAFLHAYGGYGTAIEGQDFFAYWLKARGLGLPVGLEDFSLTAAAARQGRLLIPDDETEKYGRSDYGYHLPAAAYARSLRGLAAHDGIAIHTTDAVEIVRSDKGIAAVAFDGQQIAGDLFVDATGEGLLADALGSPRESWADAFPADRMLVASAPKFGSIPAYAEIRANMQGWTGLYPSQAQTHVVQLYASSLCSDEEAYRAAAGTGGLTLSNVTVRRLDPGMRAQAWSGNVVAIGDVAAGFDPLHNVDLLGAQLGLIQLLAFYPVSSDFSAERAEYNRLMRSSYERLRDFQALHYRINAYPAAFWARGRQGETSVELAHRIALFQARGEIAPYEDESFAPDSWRAFFIGHGLVPDSYPPAIDRTSPEVMKAQFRHMLGFVKEHVLRQPTHDAYLRIPRGAGMGEVVRIDRDAAPSDLDALPRVAEQGPPTPAEFAALIAAEQPVVLRGLADRWPAVEAGRTPAGLIAYLKSMDRGMPTPVMEAPAKSGGRFAYGPDMREFSFTKRRAPIGETLDRIERNLGQANAPFVAIQMLPLADNLPDFLRQNPMPLLPAEIGPRLWIGGPLKTQTHNDRDHNLACVIAGRRRFALFPPAQVSNLYVGPLDNPPPLSLVDPEAPDLERFPKYAAAIAAAQVAWLEPGDALFMPKYWWHHVTSLAPFNAMANYWWGDSATGIERPNDVFLAALLALRDLPAGERTYWREMFETYVFGGDDAVAHIPEELRGALGRMNPRQRAALRQQLMMAFLKSS